MQEAFWNLYARWYDRLAVLQPYQELQALVLAQLGDVPPNARILDAACGTGYLLMELVKKYPLAEITGIERSVTMARQTRQKLSRHRRDGGAGYNAKLLELDLNKPLGGVTGWKDASFDVIISVNTLYALNDPKAFLAECRRLLATDGVLVIVNPWVPEPERVLYNHIHEMLALGNMKMYLEFAISAPKIVSMYVTNMVIAKRAKDRIYHFYKPEQLAELIEKSGFHVEYLDQNVYACTCCLITAR